jgi:uridine kinase
MPATGQRTRKRSAQAARARIPLLVAIVGGSGSGKTWLAGQLQNALGKKNAARISLDDFYRDRSHLPHARRARVNYDHPRAIDWPRFECVLRDCLARRATRIPQYDFANHSRLPATRKLNPAGIILVDGLWLLRRPAVRRLFPVRIFIDCSAKVRLHRRLARDLLVRGRNKASVQRQFREAVEPMNTRYVVPQQRWAHIILKSAISRSVVRHLAGQLSSL